MTKTVMLKADIIGPKYKSIGWVEQEHSWKTCNCINIASEFIPYADIERLDHDMGIVESIKYKENGRDIEGSTNAPMVERMDLFYYHKKRLRDPAYFLSVLALHLYQLS